MNITIVQFGPKIGPNFNEYCHWHTQSKKAVAVWFVTKNGNGSLEKESHSHVISVPPDDCPEAISELVPGIATAPAGHGVTNGGNAGPLRYKLPGRHDGAGPGCGWSSGEETAPSRQSVGATQRPAPPNGLLPGFSPDRCDKWPAGHHARPDASATNPRPTGALAMAMSNAAVIKPPRKG